jgi:hypothetical protein
LSFALVGRVWFDGQAGDVRLEEIHAAAVRAKEASSTPLINVCEILRTSILIMCVPARGMKNC